MSNSSVETREFQTEIRQLLDIVINSLYTEREIFLRELISNAADAMEKVRYLQLSGQEVKDRDLPLEISLETDDNAHTLTIIDAGIGMTKEELVENLGTIAHSGSKEFIKLLTQGDNKDLNLIGQFGVGFYAAFMAADKVVLYTRSYQPDAQSYVWTSEGTGSYQIEEGPELARGTKIVLHLKENAYEFSSPEAIKRVIRQYSSFVPYPISVNGEKVNTVQALWTKNKSEITEEEYTEFYKFIANAYDEPLFRLHFSSDAPLSLNTLLFVPQENFEKFGFGRLEPGVSVYCKKVLIQEKSKEILPEWLRFVKGVVDSEELPLNISRETMQDSALIAKINRVVTGRFLKFLNEQAASEPEKYKGFWEKFGMFIKEGAATDFTHKQELVKLLRFESSAADKGELISLADYVGRMKEGQSAIYYVNGPTREAIEAGPYLEVFRKQDFEVIYTHEPVDDYILNMLGEFEGKKLVSADQADLDVGQGPEIEGAGLPAAEVEGLNAWVKEVLGEQVTEVRESKRLVDSPAIALSAYGTYSMQRVMQMTNRDLNASAPSVLELNTAHSMIQKLNELRKLNDPFARTAAEQIFENARIAAGLIVDPREMVKRLNKILEKALG
ncbi:MAG: molecular chaperone HtpG [Desulfitobacteriaceae bacterium]